MIFRICLYLSLILPLVAKAEKKDSVGNQSIMVSYEWNSFSQDYNFQWHQGTLEYKTNAWHTPVIARVNYGQRFQQNGWQTELEAYPRLSSKIYAYTALAYSANVPVFPGWRTGASLYFSLPHAWELEAGGRYLYFDKPVWLTTTGIGKYIGNWLLQGRAFIKLNGTTSFDNSYFATARYYYSGGADYMWIQAGTGVAADESQAVLLQASQLHRNSITGGIRGSVKGRHLFTGTIGWADNEYRKGIYGHQLTLSVGYGLLF